MVVDDCDYIWIYVAPATGCQGTEVKVYCDGNLALDLNFSTLSTSSFTPTTPKVSLLLYSTAGVCALVISKNFEFKQSLKITATNVYGAQVVSGTMSLNLIS